MAWRTDTDAGVISAVRDQVAALPAVEQVAIDDDQNLLCIVCQPGSDFSSTALGARSAIEREGQDPDAWRIDVVVRPDSPSGRRVRFRGLDVIVERHRNVRVRVGLEWNGRQVTGESCGEPGGALELRTAVSAVLDALEQLTGTALDLRLAGIKQIRAFDAEIMVVSLYRCGPDGQRFFGAAVVGPQPHQAAALAVLNSLNRFLDSQLTYRS